MCEAETPEIKLMVLPTRYEGARIIFLPAPPVQLLTLRTLSTGGEKTVERHPLSDRRRFCRTSGYNIMQFDKPHGSDISELPIRCPTQVGRCRDNAYPTGHHMKTCRADKTDRSRWGCYKPGHAHDSMITPCGRSLLASATCTGNSDHLDQHQGNSYRGCTSTKWSMWCVHWYNLSDVRTIDLSSRTYNKRSTRYHVQITSYYFNTS